MTIDTCVQVFKEEIEKTDQPGGSILDPQEVKAIFGGIPAIHDVHTKIRDSLGEVVSRWSEDLPVGTIFLRHVSCVYLLVLSYLGRFKITCQNWLLCAELYNGK